MTELLQHTIEPFFHPDSKVLILGSFPSPKSRETGFYYGHPQNRFWNVLSNVFEQETPQTVEEKKSFLAAHQIALWDVLASCRIRGADDSSIKEGEPNDIPSLLVKTNVRAVFTTGSKASAYYKRYCKEAVDLPHIVLPSTSPANCRYHTVDTLTDAYRILLQYL